AYREELDRLEDKINPAGRAAREFREEQAKLRAEIERSGDPTGKWTRLLEENERQMRENTRVTNQWTEWTESALERVDSAFADAWRNIGDGFGSFRDNLVNAFKQMLAELAHLAITRPIVLQIGAAMGIGGISGGALAGTDGGGGGLNIVDLARTGWNAYQLATGQGAGFLGGLGAANAAAGQFVGTALHGGAGLTTYAPLSYQVGQNVAGLAPWASGLGGAYMGWQQAGAKGAIAGGLGGWGGAKAGAALGSMVGPIGTALGAVAGGILGSIGGAGLFGSGERFKRTVGSATGSYSAGQYTSGGLADGWYAGSKTFGDDFNSSLDALNRQFSGLLGGLFDAFDVDSSINTETRTRLRRTSGKLVGAFTAELDGQILEFSRQYGKDGKIEEAMEQFADDILGEYLAESIVNSALPEYLRDQFRGLTEADQVAETLAGVIARFDGVNSALDLVGITLLETTDAGLRAADAIAAMGGGIEAFNASVGVYYDQFFSAAEKQADTIAAVEKAFAAADITLADSREAYRAMVEDIDVTTEAGQQMFASMMTLAGAADQYYSIMESRAAQSSAATMAYLQTFEPLKLASAQLSMGLISLTHQFESANAFLPRTRDGLVDLVSALDLSTERGQAMHAALMQAAINAGAYYDTLEARNLTWSALLSGGSDAVSAAAQAVRNAYAQESAALQAVINQAASAVTAAQSAVVDAYRRDVGTLQGVIDALSRSISNSRQAAIDAYNRETSALESAINEQSRIVADARGGAVEAYRREADALKETIRRFDDFADSLRDFRQQLGGDMLSVADPSKQIDVLRKQFEGLAGLASSGDQSAMDGLVDAGSRLAEAARNSAGSRTDYLRELSRIQNALVDVEKASSSVGAEAQDEYDVLAAQAESLGLINESV
ncbi:MAG: hypothetical protein GX071_11445, partial [Gammaproteobacteria bacterium]|nr:hypothetical protein [Gammaproteobacteria bacterium]